MNNQAKSGGTITHVHTNVLKWPPPHSVNTGVKRDPLPHFKFLGCYRYAVLLLGQLICLLQQSKVKANGKTKLAADEEDSDEDEDDDEDDSDEDESEDEDAMQKTRQEMKKKSQLGKWAYFHISHTSLNASVRLSVQLTGECFIFSHYPNPQNLITKNDR